MNGSRSSARSSASGHAAGRTVVEQAVGVLMVNEPCDVARAHRLLRLRAMLAGRSLEQQSTEVVVAAGCGPPPRDATPRW